MRRPLFGFIVLLLLSGCASYGVVQNTPLPGTTGEQSYSVRTFMKDWRTDENALMLAFSGGGTRAAALSFGVLKELRDTPVVSGGQTKTAAGRSPLDQLGLGRKLYGRVLRRVRREDFHRL